MRQAITTGSSFEAVAGYSRLVTDGVWAFSAGTTGFNYDEMTVSDDIQDQTRQALENIRACLTKGGFAISDIIQCNWAITDRTYFEISGKILSEFFGETHPAMMTVVCQLVDPRMKFEVQIVALKSGS